MKCVVPKVIISCPSHHSPRRRRRRAPFKSATRLAEIISSPLFCGLKWLWQMRQIDRHVGEIADLRGQYHLCELCVLHLYR